MPGEHGLDGTVSLQDGKTGSGFPDTCFWVSGKLLGPNVKTLKSSRHRKTG